MYRANLRFYFGETLFEGDGLARMERLLRAEAAGWAADLHIFQEGEHPPRRELTDLAADLRSVALERGELYADLVRTCGPELDPSRRHGGVELRGADRSLIVVVDLDDYRFAPIAGQWGWGNSVCLQVCRRRVGGLAAHDFIRRFAARACAELSPWYAHGHRLEEWDAKNLSTEGSIMAIGREDSGRCPRRSP